MELILGLPPLTQYDAGATPMIACFQKEPQLTPYTALIPKVDLAAKTPERAPFAEESRRMNFEEYDLAPEDELNRILWYLAKGPDAPYPAPSPAISWSIARATRTMAFPVTSDS
jgi:hypothetical protein